jgi:hypothetical protein
MEVNSTTKLSLGNRGGQLPMRELHLALEAGIPCVGHQACRQPGKVKGQCLIGEKLCCTY